MKILRALAAGLLSAALAASLGGCSDAKNNNDVLRMLYSSELSSLNYLVSANQADQAVGANCIDTLIEYDKYGEIKPSLAEHWEQTAGGLVWTFTLRSGVGWYDCNGEYVADVTADDFVAAAKYALTAEYASKVNNPLYVIKNAEAYYKGEITDFSKVGVEAVDDHTLRYTLAAPTPYFLSSLTYVCFMPAYGPLLDAQGAAFGSGNDKLYYCGAYILSVYTPQVEQVYTKSLNYWDSAHVFIGRIERSYNAEAATLAPEMVLRGELDYAVIGADILSSWRENHAEYLSPGRAKCDYSYFYCFNFKPTFDKVYQPENWSKAVNSLSFRKSIVAALDRGYISGVYGEGAVSLQSTITPAGFAVNDGTDYTSLAEFSALSGFFPDRAAAATFKQKAIAELTAAGAVFPVKMPVFYRPDDTAWTNETILLEQQLESALGADYVDVIPVAGPTEGFLTKVRRAGNYAFMRCNWGADYIDPQTFTSPFIEGNSYNFSYTQLEKGGETAALVKQYLSLVDSAKAETGDTASRYRKFAAAEAYLIDNAFAAPYMLSPLEYSATRINLFDRQYASCGISILRYKGLSMQDSFIDSDAFEAARLKWEAHFK